MTNIDEASEVRGEASGLFALLRAGIEDARYAMGKRVSVALRVSRAGEEEDACRIEVLCHAYGSLDADWNAYAVALKDNAGEQYQLQLDRRGHASHTTFLPEDTVLQGVGIVSSSGAELLHEAGRRAEVAAISHRQLREEQIVQRSLGAAALTDVGELFTDVVKDFRSPDGRVNARVTSSAGGQLSAVFSTSSEHADLMGAHIRFRFFTDRGKQSTGQTQLWPDQGEPSRLAGVSYENQTSLAPEQGAAANSEGKVNLAFEFEAHPSTDQRKE